MFALSYSLIQGTMFPKCLKSDLPADLLQLRSCQGDLRTRNIGHILCWLYNQRMWQFLDIGKCDKTEGAFTESVTVI